MLVRFTRDWRPGGSMAPCYPAGAEADLPLTAAAMAIGDKAAVPVLRTRALARAPENKQTRPDHDDAA